MRRLILCLVVACVVGVPAASVASAKSDVGVMCVLHAKLAAKNETPPTTSVAKGHTQIKVRKRRNDRVQDPHQQQEPRDVYRRPYPPGGRRLRRRGGRAAVRGTYSTDERAPHQAERRGNPERRHDGHCPLPEPERLLRQLPHDGVPGRRDPRPAALAPVCEAGGVSEGSPLSRA
jgi:hypothetical protein